MMVDDVMFRKDKFVHEGIFFRLNLSSTVGVLHGLQVLELSHVECFFLGGGFLYSSKVNFSIESS